MTPEAGEDPGRGPERGGRGTALITGASRGMGAGVARRLAGLGYDLVVTARDSTTARRTVASIRDAAADGARVEWIPADLSRMAEVVDLARLARDTLGGPSVVLHCAATVPRTETITPDGFESQWAVNHLAPFLLTVRLGASPGPGERPGRVITVSSQLHREGRLAPSARLFRAGPYDPRQRYRDTKLANVLFTRALAQRSDPARMVALTLHPGVAATGLLHDLRGDGVLARTRDRLVRAVRGSTPWGLEECVDRLEALSTMAVGPEDHGTYRESGRIVDPSAAALDADLAERLWERSEKALARWLPPEG